MLTIYPACFYKEEDGYSVIFPDLNHLATCGDNLEEAMDMAIDALAGYIYDEQESGNPLPEASELSSIDPVSYYRNIDSETEPGECFVSYVSVDVEAYARRHFERSVKKTLTIPYWLNKLAIRNNINFSKVLQEALKEKLL